MKTANAAATKRARAFSVNHATDTKFEKRGLRNYFEYRDLGIARASSPVRRAYPKTAASRIASTSTTVATLVVTIRME